MKDLLLYLFGLCTPIFWLCVVYFMKRVDKAIQRLDEKDDKR